MPRSLLASRFQRDLSCYLFSCVQTSGVAELDIVQRKLPGDLCRRHPELAIAAQMQVSPSFAGYRELANFGFDSSQLACA